MPTPTPESPVCGRADAVGDRHERGSQLPLKASAIDGFARAIAAQARGRRRPGAAPDGADAYVNAIAEDLQAHKGTSLVIAGDAQPPQVHALAHAINQALGNVGQTVELPPPPEVVPSDQHAALRDLVSRHGRRPRADAAS